MYSNCKAPRSFSLCSYEIRADNLPTLISLDRLSLILLSLLLLLSLFLSICGTQEFVEQCTKLFDSGSTRTTVVPDTAVSIPLFVTTVSVSHLSIKESEQ
jgi:hypothetical protein